MQELRDRVRSNLPTVLLTLLSIVQALALEFLWTHVRESGPLFELSSLSALLWIQLFTTFLGLMLIWIVYASHVMRLRWVPTTTDSVYPFVIGLLEFILIEFLGPDELGQWMICNSVVFGSMVWISHRTMKRARLDNANRAFFQHLEPATIKDFLPVLTKISVGVLAGIYLIVTGDTGWPALLALLAAAAAMVYQFISVATFWERSLADNWPQHN
ncbi:MAG: hypothetical protein ACR2Q3_16535 [Woeseiaceae bacterium]